MLGGVLSFILYIFLFIMAMVSLMSLFNNSDVSMSESKVLVTNWEHKNIKLKNLIDKGFELPYY